MEEFIKQYWLEVFFGFIVFIITFSAKYIYKRIRKEIDIRNAKLEAESKKQKLIQEGVLAILHDRLYSECQRLIDKDCVTVAEIDNLKHIYGAYHSLGGNGTGTELYNRCLKLELMID